MGPNRMWMFPVGFTTRRTTSTYLNNASYQLRVVFIGCTGLEPHSAQPRARQRHITPRGHRARTRRARCRQSAAALWAHIRHLVRVWSVSVSDVGFCLFAFPPSELSKLQSVQWQCE